MTTRVTLFSMHSHTPILEIIGTGCLSTSFLLVSEHKLILTRGHQKWKIIKNLVPRFDFWRNTDRFYFLRENFSSPWFLRTLRTRHQKCSMFLMKLLFALYTVWIILQSESRIRIENWDGYYTWLRAAVLDKSR